MTALLFGLLPACRGSERTPSPDGRAVDAEETTTGPPVPAVAEVSSTDKASGPAASLCLDLSAPRSRVILGEPVLVIASLRNCSSSARTVPDVLSPGYRFLSTFVRRPREEAEVPFEPGVVREGRGKPSRTLAPGEALSVWIPLHADRAGWFLRRPGTYDVRSSFSWEGERFDSNRIAIEVVPTASTSDARAADVIMSPELGRWSLDGATPGTKAWATLEAIPRQYPESRLAPYALLATGIARTQTVFDPTTKSFRKPDCPRAVEELQKALPRVGDPLLAAQGTAALSECLDALGQPTAARESVSQYFRTHPNAPRLPGVTDLLRPAQKTSGS